MLRSTLFLVSLQHVRLPHEFNADDASGNDLVCMYSTTARSTVTLGFLDRLWSPYEHIVHHCTDDHDQRTNHGRSIADDTSQEISSTERCKDKATSHKFSPSDR